MDPAITKRLGDQLSPFILNDLIPIIMKYVGSICVGVVYMDRIPVCIYSLSPEFVGSYGIRADDEGDVYFRKSLEMTYIHHIHMGGHISYKSGPLSIFHDGGLLSTSIGKDQVDVTYESSDEDIKPLTASYKHDNLGGAWFISASHNGNAIIRLYTPIKEDNFLEVIIDHGKLRLEKHEKQIGTDKYYKYDGISYTIFREKRDRDLHIQINANHNLVKSGLFKIPENYEVFLYTDHTIIYNTVDNPRSYGVISMQTFLDYMMENP